MDGILVFNEMQSKHDERIRAVLGRLRSANATLNEKKCQFYDPEDKFLGQIVKEYGVNQHPEKDMPEPKGIKLRDDFSDGQSGGKVNINETHTRSSDQTTEHGAKNSKQPSRWLLSI